MTKEQFLIAMRSLAASVSVISARDATGKTYAMTASSVTSLSIDPPAILVCVNKEASIHDTLVEDASLCINILQKNQQEIANLCSSKDLESQRFENDFWDVSDTPFLKNAQAKIFCKIDQTVPYHSHTIVLAKALKAESKGEFNTLMYADGGYLN